MLRPAVGQNGQWMPQIDHLIEAVTKEFSGDGHVGRRNAQKTGFIEYVEFFDDRTNTAASPQTPA